jgi:hypothetical protein
MKAFLASYEAKSPRPAKATLLTREGHQLSVTPESDELTQTPGILLIEDIDHIWINHLCTAVSQSKFLLFTILGHILFDEVNETEAVKELVEQVKGWYWMSRDDSHACCCSQYDIVHDEEGGTLHFATYRYPARHYLKSMRAIRISTFDVTGQFGEYWLESMHSRAASHHAYIDSYRIHEGVQALLERYPREYLLA